MQETNLQLSTEHDQKSNNNILDPVKNQNTLMDQKKKKVVKTTS